MVADALSPIAPARVRCLLVPTGRITQARFLEFVKRLQQESLVRLGDVSPNPQPGRETFSPLAFPSGVVLYDLTVADPSPGQRALYPFDISQEPLVILGLADGLEYDAQPADQANGEADSEGIQARSRELRLDLSHAIETIRSIHNVALVHRIFLFDDDKYQGLDMETVVTIPPPLTSPTTAIKTKMCDLTSALLSEMAPYARSIQSLSTIETPRQAVPDNYVRPQAESDLDSRRQSWFPGSGIRSSSPSLGLSRLANRASLPAHLFGSATSGPTSAPSTPSEENQPEGLSPNGDNAATTFDQMRLRSPERRQTGLDTASSHMSVQSLGPDATSERGRNQGRGRIGIVLGSMYLIAGRWSDAVREFVQAGLSARSTNDHIWHAKAVEMILVALLLCAWAGIEFEVPPLCLPVAERSSILLGKSSKKNENMANETFVHQSASREVVAENIKTLASVLPEIVQHIVRLYTRTTAEPVAQLVLSGSFIRLSKLSAVLLYYPDLSDKEALEAIVLNTKLRTSSDSNSILSLQTPAKAEISSLVLACIPPIGLQEMIDLVDRLAIYAGIAAVLGMLGYDRKKAFILRELLAVLLPALERDAIDLDLGFSVLAGPLTNGIETNGYPNGTVETSSGDGHKILYDFLLQLCRIYGSVITQFPDRTSLKTISRFPAGETADLQEQSIDEAALLAAKIENDAMTRQFGSRRLKVDVLLACISVCEVIPDLRGALSFSSSLLSTVSSGIAPGPQTIDGGPSLSPETQSKVAETMQQASSAAISSDEQTAEGEYWDEFLIREVEVLPTSNDLAVVKRKRSELAAVKQNLAKKTEGPFIVNQFNLRASVSKREHLVVAGEKFCFSILLQNLYDIVLNIDRLEMDVTGIEVVSKMENFAIGAYQTQRLRVVAQAMTSGAMTVSGCLVKIRNCAIRRYPIFRQNWRPKEDLRVKRHGLAMLSGPRDRPSSTASDITKASGETRPVPSIIQATVVAQQPRMVIQSTSLVQNNIMVLEGERRKLTITTQNASDQSIDFVALSFDDSALPLLQAAVQDRELPAADLYELEYGIYRKAALRWPGASNDIKIDPHQELIFEVEVLGKPGLTSGVVHFDYALIGNAADGDENIYTRRTSISFSITVNPSIDLIRNDVLSLTGPLAHPQPLVNTPLPEGPLSRADWTQQLLQPLRDTEPTSADTTDYCLLLLDFYNSWANTLIVMPQVHRHLNEPDDWQNAFQLSEPVDPGQSTRFLVPVPRMHLHNPYAPIPSLNPASKRQFVVSAGKVSEGYERSSRDAFWHREELLKYIRVVWTEPTTKRAGFVEMRATRLTVRMLDALKLESLVVELGITGSDTIVQSAPDHFRVPTDDFVTMTSKLTNRSSQPIHPLLRLQPSIRNQPYNLALDLSKKFAFTGLLQQPLQPLQAGESVEIQLGGVFLCSGEFEISASVEEMRIWRSPGKEDKQRERSGSLVDLDVLSTERTDRRIWFAKEACKVDVYDLEDQ